MKAINTSLVTYAKRPARQRGAVVVKFFWWPLIISIGLSILLTIILNVIF